MERLVNFHVNPYYRAATKKSGPTISKFLQKMDEQMGVVIVGFAAYRDNAGKLCTFEFVSLVQIFCTNRLTLTSFCTKDTKQVTFPRAHPKEIEQFLGQWGRWVSQKGIIHVNIYFPNY